MTRNLPELLDWLREAWASEPFPERMHSRGVFYGQPDSTSCPPRARLEARLSSPSDLTGGSVLGSPAESQAFVRWLDEPRKRDKEGYYCTPLRSALDCLAKGTGHRHAQPMMARCLWTLIRADFDWAGIAESAGWGVQEYAAYIAAGIDEVKHLYKLEPTR